MSKMTDNHIADDGKKVEEVIKALEFCSHCVCDDDKTETKCPYYNMSFCKNYLRKQSLDVINRQQEKNKELKKEKYRLQKALNQAEDYRLIAIADAIKEFADKVKGKQRILFNYIYSNADFGAIIDNLVKEMVGEQE